MADRMRRTWLEENSEGIKVAVQETEEAALRGLRLPVKVAMGLTDMCCEKGVGRVSSLAHHPVR